jgi:hypothetical protein
VVVSIPCFNTTRSTPREQCGDLGEVAYRAGHPRQVLPVDPGLDGRRGLRRSRRRGIDLPTFTDMLKDKVLYPSPDFQRRGLQDAIEPFREAYFAGQ